MNKTNSNKLSRNKLRLIKKKKIILAAVRTGKTGNNGTTHKTKSDILLTSVQIRRIEVDGKKKNIIVLRNAKKSDVNTTKVLISKSNKVATQIAETNLQLLNLHNNGMLDLSGDAF